jgi:hypothetical protein
VLQANKRDHAHAVPIDSIRSMLDSMDLRVGVVESIATDGSGIREAFVFAVRLALDRVRELMRTGHLLRMRPEVDTAQELLDLLKRSEDGSMEYAAAAGLVHTRVSDVRPTSIVSEALAQAARENETVATRPFGGNGPVVGGNAPVGGNGYVPATPDERVGSGMVWPPVDGRTVLQEVAQAHVQLSRSEQGDWFGAANGRWQIHSAASQVFEDIDAGRMELVQSARVHAANARGKSIERCVVLAGDGRGRYRLWQIARVPSTAEVS